MMGHVYIVITLMSSPDDPDTFTRDNQQELDDLLELHEWQLKKFFKYLRQKEMERPADLTEEKLKQRRKTIVDEQNEIIDEQKRIHKLRTDLLENYYFPHQLHDLLRTERESQNVSPRELELLLQRHRERKVKKQRERQSRLQKIERYVPAQQSRLRELERERGEIQVVESFSPLPSLERQSRLQELAREIQLQQSRLRELEEEQRHIRAMEAYSQRHPELEQDQDQDQEQYGNGIIQDQPPQQTGLEQLVRAHRERREREPERRREMQAREEQRLEPEPRWEPLMEPLPPQFTPLARQYLDELQQEENEQNQQNGGIDPEQQMLNKVIKSYEEKLLQKLRIMREKQLPPGLSRYEQLLRRKEQLKQQQRLLQRLQWLRQNRQHPRLQQMMQRLL